MVEIRRTKTMFNEMDDIRILYQYLYLSEDKSIAIDNGVAILDIRMTDNGYFKCKNRNFPELDESSYTDMMTIPNMLGIIDQLKTVKAVEYPDNFKTRWEEIKTTVATSATLNNK